VSWDKTTRLWDDRTGRQLIAASGELLAFGADDRRLAFRNQTGFVADEARVLEFASGEECRTLQDFDAREKGPHHLDVSPDNRLLLSSGPDGARLWDTATAEQVAVLYRDRHELGFNSTAMFHPDGTSVLTIMEDGVYRWPIKRIRQQGSLLVTIGPPQHISDLRGDGWACLDRTGRHLATIREEAAYVIALDEASQPVRLTGHADMSRIAISPDGRWVATGTWHGLGVVMWDAKTGRKVWDLFPEAASATVAFSPDGKSLVSGANNIYRIWQLGTWEHRDLPASFPYLIAFSDDGETMAISHSPSAVRLLNPNTGQILAELEASNPQMMSWLRISPDGSRLAVACGTHVIQLWDLQRIRQQLSTMGLDWNARPYPPAGADADVPIEVMVDQTMPARSGDGSSGGIAPGGLRPHVNAISKPRD
jgi:WD40 repeat protein